MCRPASLIPAPTVFTPPSAVRESTQTTSTVCDLGDLRCLRLIESEYIEDVHEGTSGRFCGAVTNGPYTV